MGTEIPYHGNIHRLGKFSLSRRVLDREWEHLKALFEEVIVCEAVLHFERRETVYYAMSEHFDEIKESEQIPEYVAEWYTDEDGELVNLKWKRRGG